MIRVWRPISGPVLDWPLAVCDFRSIDVEEDLVATDNVRAHSVSETYNVFHNLKHKWNFVNKQTSNDVLLFKGFDTAQDVAQCQYPSVQRSLHS